MPLKVIEFERKAVTQVHADEMVPLVREMAAREFYHRRSSEKVARSYRNGRGHIHDCVDLDLHNRLLVIERRLGIVPGFIRQVA